MGQGHNLTNINQSYNLLHYFDHLPILIFTNLACLGRVGNPALEN